jgi:hypothetical protein
MSQLLVEDSWQGYASKSDARNGYALLGCFPGTSVPWKHRASGRPCGNDMLYFGKATLKVTPLHVTSSIKLPFGKAMPDFVQASANLTTTET